MIHINDIMKAILTYVSPHKLKISNSGRNITVSLLCPFYFQSALRI